MEWKAIAARLGALVWGPGMLALLAGTGLLLTVRTRALPLRRFPGEIKKLLRRPAAAGTKEGGANFTPFEAMTTALAGAVGTGNIAGVAGALAVGGPGTVFWMWVSALLGMSTKYAEIALAVRYRAADAAGRRFGGPMLTIEKGLGPRWKPLAGAFALFGGLAAFGAGNAVQSSEIAGAAGALFGLDRGSCALILTLLTGFVLLGGRRGIGRATAALVPLSAGLYLLVGLWAIALHLAELPALLARIVREAFSLRAAGGGLLGTAMLRSLRSGFARGVFSNEAGLGSAPIAHAASAGEEPCAEGTLGVAEVLIDTLLICTVTALCVLLSGVLDEGAAFPSMGEAAACALDRLLPGRIGSFVVRLSLPLFAFSSILSWACCGESCWGYLLGDGPVRRTVFRLLFALACLPGALGGAGFWWELSDALNGLMALPNLIALVLLSGEVAELTRAGFVKRAPVSRPSAQPRPLAAGRLSAARRSPLPRRSGEGGARQRWMRPPSRCGRPKNQG
ncbi:MAG: alanine:cation symporter family protein [Oscillospiraceae bacterium]|nr:alanine:cation symporter family protein [Oscillospiraceae bacterium]